MRIKNRSAGVVVYSIPDMNIRRRFAPGEVKDISKEEISKLMYQPGGHYLLVNYLQANQEDIAQLDMPEPEKEYYYTDEQIKELMTSGSLDEFLDALDFAPEGIIDLFKKYAVELPLRDLYKIDALKKKTGFDTTKALENAKAIETEETVVVETAPKRRVSAETSAKYKIVN